MKDPFAEIYSLCDTGSASEKIKNLRKAPLYLDVELTNTCNLRCAMCPTGLDRVLRKKGFMSGVMFQKIILESILNGVRGIRFIRWGEPLLHPQLLQFVEAVRKAGILAHINTNGVFADDEFLKRIVKIPLDSIKFSFQGIDDEGYKRWRGGDWHKLVFQIMKLHQIRANRKLPFVRINTTVTNEKQDEIDHFKKKMGELCDKVEIGKTKNILGGEKGCSPECPEVFDKLSINWDGTVSACCADYDNLMLAGDLNTQSLKEIWNGAQMEYYRKMLAEKRHSELELCRSCCL